MKWRSKRNLREQWEWKAGVVQWWVCGMIENTRSDSPLHVVHLFIQLQHFQMRFYFKRENWAWWGVKDSVCNDRDRKGKRETGKREKERQRLLSAKTSSKIKSIVYEQFFTSKKHKRLQRICAPWACFSQICFGLFFAAFCWYWITLASTWPPWIPALIQ